VEKTLDYSGEYRKYTVLWRSLDRNYKNREERRSALQELRGEMLIGLEIDPKQNKKFNTLTSGHIERRDCSPMRC
jgi:hypothetical protein